MDTKVLRIDDLFEYLDHQYEAPCILYLNTQHFVVAQKRGKKLIVFDPATGKITYSLNKKDSIPYASQFAHYLIIPTPSKKFCVRKGDIFNFSFGSDFITEHRRYTGEIKNSGYSSVCLNSFRISGFFYPVFFPKK